MNDFLSETIDVLQEMKRMHQLNLELLEQLDVTCGYLLDNGVQVPNEEHFLSLLTKAKALLSEIQAETPKTLQYQKLADKKKHLRGTDGEVPVPSHSQIEIC